MREEANFFFADEGNEETKKEMEIIQEMNPGAS